MRGGRSGRYEERRAERGTKGQYIEAWSDDAARAVLAGLHAESEEMQCSIGECTEAVLGSEESVGQFINTHCKRLPRAGRELARSIMLANRQKIDLCRRRGDKRGAKAKMQGFLRPLRSRGQAGREVRSLEVERVSGAAGPESFHAWLSPQPAQERMRDIQKNARILEGIGRWPLAWLDKPGVVCYERAHGRVVNERGGKADAEFLKGVVKTVALPTLVANPGDHYVLVGPGTEPRFLTVEEVARGFEVPVDSPLMDILLDEAVMSEKQAVSCLGRGLHVGVARALVAMLWDRGTIEAGLTYASAYSGVDMFAAALEVETGGDWEYRHASEESAVARAGLLGAWGRRGLVEERCFEDACGADAIAAEAVDLFVITPECEPHSRRNHGASDGGQAEALGEIWDGLEYVRRRRPRAVVMENVAEPALVGAVTGMLSRLEGYVLETGKVDPFATFGAPMVRERQYWVLTRTDLWAL